MSTNWTHATPLAEPGQYGSAMVPVRVEGGNPSDPTQDSFAQVSVQTIVDAAYNPAQISAAEAAASAASASASETVAQTSAAQTLAAAGAQNNLGSVPTTLPYEVTTITGGIGSGTGGTPGTYVGGVSGGPAGFQWTYTIGSGGSIASYAILNPGISTASAVPTLSLPSGGLSGATAPMAATGVIPVNRIFAAPSADGSELLAWGNNAGSLATAPFGGTQQAITANAAAAVATALEPVNAIVNPGGIQAIPGLIAAILDALGNRTWLEANNIDGGPSPLALQLLAKYVTLPITMQIAGLLVAITDALGNRTWLEANTVNGGPTANSLALFAQAKTTTALSTIACYGDSLTQGGHGYTGSWPQDLAALVGNNVINLGISGETSVEIAIRAGGVVPLLTFPGGSLPASTSSVTVTTNITTALSTSGQPNRTYNVTIRNVPCVLTYNTTTAVWSIARVTAGTALLINPTCPVPAVPVTPYTACLNILWAGRNDSPISSAYANIAATVAWFQQLGIPFLVFSVTNMGSEPSGSSGYNAIIALNAQIEALAPRNYADIRGRLIQEGLALAGLTPTLQDTAAIAADQIPPSLLWSGDGLLLHTNNYGDIAIGLIAQDELNQRGWL